MNVNRHRRNERGATTVETALIFSTVLIPGLFGAMALAQATWTWSGVIHLTRLGAQYAATHCWQDSAGSNVISYMQTNVPPMIDARQIAMGPAQIQVQYWTQDSANRETIPYDCTESCSLACMPDAVTVTISGYQFQSLTRLIGISPIDMPAVSTTRHIQSLGADPETGTAVP